MQNFNKWPHVERLIYVAVALAILTWFMWAFGVNVAAWVLGGFTAVALFALGAIFAMMLFRRALELAADLLHEQAAASSSGHKALQDMYRTEREHAKLAGRGMQLEARQTGASGARAAASWEVVAQQETGAQTTGYGPVYVE